MASDFAEFGGRHGETSLPTGATVYPVKVRAKQPLTLTPSQFDRLQEVMGYRRRGEVVPEIKQYWLEDELAKATGRPFPEGVDPVAWIQQQGYDAVVMPPRRYGRNMAPGDSEVMVFDPANIRSRFAKFDPRRIGDPNLLAGIGGGVLLSSLARPRQPETR